MAQIKIEGQTIDLEDEIAESDDLLRAALQASWPDAKTATFTRSDKRKEKGGKLVVTVTKKAGTKGALIEALFAAPETINPAIEMSRRISRLQHAGEIGPTLIAKLMPEISAAVALGARDLSAGAAALRDLSKAPSVASEELPLGF